MILKEYNLSVRLPQERAIDTGITLVQNDKDVYKLNIRIFDGVNEIDYADVASATITFLKRDNNVVQGNMTVDADKLSYTLGTNEIACPGKVLVSIQLFGTTERLSTARFVMSVERDLVTAEAVQSTSEFAILQQLKQDLEAIDVVELTNEFNVHKAEDVTKDDTPHGMVYKEGTFTPQLSSTVPGGNEHTYTTRTGSYIKIGKAVHITLTIEIETFDPATSGTIYVGGLPVAAIGTHALSFGRVSKLNIDDSAIDVYPTIYNNRIYFYQILDNAEYATLKFGAFQNGSLFTITGTYFTA